MWLVGLGLVFVLLKSMGWTAVAEWSWWQVLIPFGLAIVWWTWADWSGYTKRKRFEKEEARHQKRIDRLKKQLGTLQRPK